MRALNRRGMSPLIATVLLMAFAVALGGMIMNYTSNLDAGSAEECENIKLQTSQFCYDGKQIQVSTRNQGDTIVGGLAIMIDNPTLGNLKIDIPDSRLTKGKSVSKAIPITVDDDTSVSLYAGVDGLNDVCAEPQLAKKPLPNCN